jgi:2-hydroxy-3-keto-5-methylthiopentenyl-1-phosphate phosphatase
VVNDSHPNEMNIEVRSRSVSKREMVTKVCEFFSKELSLKTSRYQLTVFVEPHLKRDHHMKGMVAKIGERELAMFIDSGMNMQDTIECLAHEMVHVKQFARGQLSYDIKPTKTHTLWFGKRHPVDPYESPWELEAYSKEKVLANRVFKILVANIPQKVKKTKNKSTKK